MKNRTGCTVTPKRSLGAQLLPNVVLWSSSRRYFTAVRGGFGTPSYKVCLSTYLHSSFHNITEVAWFWITTLSHWHRDMRSNRTHTGTFPICYAALCWNVAWDVTVTCGVLWKKKTPKRHISQGHWKVKELAIAILLQYENYLIYELQWTLFPSAGR